MKKILLLDDNLDIVEIVEEVLTYEHYEVKSITKSSDFMRLAESFHPDLIILDYKLGDGNGGELCRELKAHPNLGHIPVIIFSAYLKPDTNFRDFGCDAVINKPFDLVELLQTVEQLT